MTLPSHAGFVIVPLHLVAGYLFGLIPASVYQPGYYAVYGGIVMTLLVTLVVYGTVLWHQQPGMGTLWLHFLLGIFAVALPFFTLDFKDTWSAIIYLPIMGGSLAACLIVGHVVVFAARP